MLDLAPEDEFQIKRLTNSIRTMQEFDLPPVLDDLPFIQSTIRGIKMARYLKFLYLLYQWRNDTNRTFAKKLNNAFLRESFELLYDDQEVNMVVMTMPLASFDKKSAGYPIGGSMQFAKYLEESYLQLGGKIHYNTPVKKIITENNTAKGLLVRNNVSHYSDAIISAADWNWTIFDALDGKYTDKKILELKELKKLKVFYSVLQFSFGINKDLSDQPHFSRFPLKTPVHCPDGTKHERLEVHVYNYDPTFAPKGKTSVVVSFYTEHADFWIDLRKNNRPKYREAKKEMLETITNLLDERLGGIKDQIEEVDFATPATYLRYTNNWKGSTQGWLPSENLIALSPIKFTLPNLANFYMASHWNQPGGGLPIAISAGRDLTKKICKEQKKKFTTKKTSL
ncbi:MAG: NAD(P)/FAD-dependent oxidoreductase [Bacteroidetes bacterium]|nr:NAD(P)/FAD-dependent oxidoreductase [Bacteroidota bacterium]